jgi:hypothetical protein
MLNIRVLTWSLATFTTVSYIVCVVYGLIVPESLHMVQISGDYFARFQVVNLWGVHHRTGGEFSLWSLCGIGLHADLQFLPTQMGIVREVSNE